MERTVVKFNSFEDAENAEILQMINLTTEQRQDTKALKLKFYGENPPDIRASIRTK